MKHMLIIISLVNKLITHLLYFSFFFFYLSIRPTSKVCLFHKKWLNRGERRVTYLTHVCGLPRSVESLENRRKQKTVAFSQTLWLLLAVKKLK